MQIMINISEDDYRKVQDGRASVSMMQKAIRNGTPLPKEKGYECAAPKGMLVGYGYCNGICEEFEYGKPFDGESENK